MNIGRNDQKQDLRKSLERKGSTFKAFYQGIPDNELETDLEVDRLDLQSVKGKVEFIKGSLLLNF